MPTRKPISIEGVTYPSQSEAARAYGVTHTCIREMLARGNASIPSQRPSAIPVVLDDGRKFASMHAAARGLKTSYSYVKRCVRAGTPCHGHHIRLLTELDIILAEIEKRNREPYQFSR